MKCRAKRVHAPRLRPLFTRVLHAARSPSTQRRSRPPFTRFCSVHALCSRIYRPVHAHRSHIRCTRSRAALTRSRGPAHRSAELVAFRYRARRRRARARARARPLPVAPLTPPLLPAALGGTWCHLTPHAVSALEHARFRGAPGVGCWRRGRRAPCRPTQQQPADGPTAPPSTLTLLPGSRSAPQLPKRRDQFGGPVCRSA